MIKWLPDNIRISKFSVKMFLLIIFCVVLPLCVLCFYVKNSMENFIQEKMSEKIIQNISKNERNIPDALQKLAIIANAFTYDDELRDRMSSTSYSEYSNAIYFDKIIKSMYINGDYNETQGIKIIIFDNYNRIYSNWSLNYQNYEFMLEQDWVKESKTQGGHAVWAMFNPAYVIEEKDQGGKYISLAKAILEDGTTGANIGTIIISIEQIQFSKLLLEYAYEEDKVYVIVEDGDVLLTNDDKQHIGSRDLTRIIKLADKHKTGSMQTKVNSLEYLISYYTIPKPWVFDNQQMKVFHFTNYSEVREEVGQIVNRMNITIFISLCFIVGIAVIATKYFVRPIVILSKQMEEYSLDSPIHNIDTKRSDEIGRLNKAFCKMSYNLKGLFIKLSEENEIKERYRFESLRAQLNPHFLFNTLTSIRWMAIIRGADNIVDSIDALAHMLKYSMNRDDSLVTLEEEVNNIKNYVYIQNCRYGEHCKLDIDIDEALYDLKTMKFILQPIVENAIMHGYDKSEIEIEIKISAQIVENKLIISISDNGIGMSYRVINAFEHAKNNKVKESKLTGIGLTNVDDFFQTIKSNIIFYVKLYIEECETNKGRPCRKEISLVKSFVQSHLAEELSVTKISSIVNMSESRFSHVFKEEVGISFMEYVNQLKEDEAMHLLKNTDMKIGEIADMVGIYNPNYFSTLFKKRTGMSPNSYRRKEWNSRN